MPTTQQLSYGMSITRIVSVSALLCVVSLSTAYLANAQTTIQDRQAANRAERVKELASRLQPISAEQGGGYYVDWELCQVRDEDLVDVVHIPGIRSLHDNGFGHVAWAHFGELTELEYLSSYSDNVTDDDLSCLSNLSKLERLTLDSSVTRPDPSKRSDHRPYFTAKYLESLRNMNHLKQLDLRGDGISNDALIRVGAVPGLLTLTIGGHFTNDGLQNLVGLKSLRHLSLDGNFDDEGLSHLADLTNLESLVLMSDRLTGTGLGHLSKLPKLRMLKLGRLGSTLTLTPLKDWPALESLNLSTDRMTDEMLLTLPETDQVKSLSLHGAHAVTDDGLLALSRLRNLEELDLIFTKVTDVGIENIASLTKLRALCLGETHHDRMMITEVGLRKLARLPVLERLDMRYVNLVPVDLQVLAIPSLTMLHLEGIEGYVPKKEELRILRSRLPRLARPSSRVVIKANLINDAEFQQYDVYANRMAVEW